MSGVVGARELYGIFETSAVPQEEADIASVVAFVYGQTGEKAPTYLATADTKQDVMNQFTRLMREMVRTANFLRGTYGTLFLLLCPRWCVKSHLSLELMRARLLLLESWRQRLGNMDNYDGDQEVDLEEKAQEPPQKKRRIQSDDMFDDDMVSFF